MVFDGYLCLRPEATDELYLLRLGNNLENISGFLIGMSV